MKMRKVRDCFFFFLSLFYILMIPFIFQFSDLVWIFRLSSDVRYLVPELSMQMHDIFCLRLPHVIDDMCGAVGCMLVGE
jgi:hypothetical protein